MPRQLGELSPGTASSHSTHAVPVGTRLFFRANDGIHGTDLWVSDGTEAGTTLVKDLHPALGTANIWPMTGLRDRLLSQLRGGRRRQQRERCGMERLWSRRICAVRRGQGHDE